MAGSWQTLQLPSGGGRGATHARPQRWGLASGPYTAAQLQQEGRWGDPMQLPSHSGQLGDPAQLPSSSSGQRGLPRAPQLKLQPGPVVGGSAATSCLGKGTPQQPSPRGRGTPELPSTQLISSKAMDLCNAIFNSMQIDEPRNGRTIEDGDGMSLDGWNPITILLAKISSQMRCTASLRKPLMEYR
ncbi:hypothetical protein UY3_15764 [Chelonia mydas]|uniref:Uncharacterized protein n=1 Tax=Chelonia mydas TaxID=8469 RepID=M7AVT6_CHEMY|nr:hypothetical protein UY3_15764 [Chelonia mydas]